MIETFYTSGYGATTETNSMSKLPLIAEQLQKNGLARFIEPDKVGVVESLKQLHIPNYVNAFIHGIGTLAETNGFKWSEQIRDAVLLSNAGMVGGSKLALTRGGVVANLGSGYHHAKYAHGDAYCTFNGLALVAQANPCKKIFVLDCDEHQGDGTNEFTERLTNLYNYSIFGTRMDVKSDGAELLGGRSWDREVRGWYEYESALYDGLMKTLSVQPDLIVYQAGVDCYKNDGMSLSGLCSSQLYTRDDIVFEFARDANIPMLFCMAGGYGEHAVFHHTQTFRAALDVYK